MKNKSKQTFRRSKKLNEKRSTTKTKLNAPYASGNVQNVRRRKMLV